MSSEAFTLSTKSQVALKDIYKSTSRDFGDEQADVYLKGFYETFRTLSEHPGIGQDVSEYKLGLRRFRYRSHTILYLENDGIVLIYLVLHNHHDVRKHILDA